MKYLTLLCVVLMGCTPKVETNNFILKEIIPEGLKDCIYYNFKEDGVSQRGWNCPNSTTSTSYKSGKSTRYMVFVND